MGKEGKEGRKEGKEVVELSLAGQVSKFQVSKDRFPFSCFIHPPTHTPARGRAQKQTGGGRRRRRKRRRKRVSLLEKVRLKEII